MKLLLSVFFVFLLPLQGADKGDVVERWNAEFLAAVRRQAPPPCVVARNLAILHLALWRAARDAGDGNEARAIAGAGHEVCTVLFSGDRAGFDALLKEYPAAKGQALESGRTAARKTLSERADDGANTTVHYQPKLAAGVWQRTTNNRPPELPHWGLVKPFVLTSAEMFRPPPPPALDSAQYAADVKEVRTLGEAKTEMRSDEQTLVAKFWSDFSYTTSPVGRWNEIARNAMEGRSMTTREKARFFAVLNVTLADVAIAVWDCKYHYRFWRPVSAIHESFDDSNTGTVPNGKWVSLLPSPSHPDYVSGHSAFSGAAAAVLRKTLGPPKDPITVTNHDMPGVVRVFSTYDAIADEAGRSRIYGGIHFSSACKQGARLGIKVADEVMVGFARKFSGP